MIWRNLAGAAVGMLLLALLAFGLSRDASFAPSPLVGGPAPDFALETLAHDSLRLSDLAGDVVVLNFWASWCLACIDEHPVLVQAQRAYEDEGLRVVGVVYQDTRNNALRWMRERGGDWPNVLDSRSRTAIKYGVRGVPETFFIGRNGIIAYRQIGPVPPAVLTTLLPRLLAAGDSASAELPPEERVGTSPGYVRSSPAAPALEGTRRRN